MNAEFQWWLLILGIVIGGALVYLVLADLQDDAASADVVDEPRSSGAPVQALEEAPDRQDDSPGRETTEPDPD